ncbi:Poly A RNA polymerase GLD2-B [Taenia solium]|eukprot:TsM_001196800 transcript=TsM_001196800 gene=TsM_001196800
MFGWRDYNGADSGKLPIKPPIESSSMLPTSWAVAILAVGIAALAFKNFLKSRNDSSAKYFSDSKLFIVGSSVNGFGMEGSDTDLCLVIASPDLQAGQCMVSEMEKIRNRLSSRINPRTCWVVDAQVPILKFRDHLSGVECELHVNNVVGIRNTHLLAMYARVDHRLPTLGVFVRHWAQKMGIHGGSLGKLSTYALLLMVIQCLQCGCSPPVLPNLQARFPVSSRFTD